MSRLDLTRAAVHGASRAVRSAASARRIGLGAGARRHRLSLLLALGLAGGLAGVAGADSAPPPWRAELRIDGSVAGQAVQGIDLVACLDEACTQTRPLGQPEGKSLFQPERLTCANGTCEAWLGLDRYLAVVNTGGRTLRSDPFEPESFLLVRVTDTSVQVGSDPQAQSGGFVGALTLTLLIELLIAAVYAWWRRRRSPAGFTRRLLGTVLVANVVSLFVAWFVIPAVLPFGLGEWVAVEAFAWLFEAAAIWRFNRASMSFPKSVGLSLVMNTASALVYPLIIASSSGTPWG